MESVKRDYRSSLRAAQAGETRRAVVAAATRLFIESGYTSTTIDAIAAAAAVSRKTVFTAVGGKPELLSTALDWAVAGDDQAVALADRYAMIDVLAQDNPAQLIAGWVHVLVEIDERIAPLFVALEVAAESDESARLLLAQSQRQRLDGARLIIRRLAQMRALSTEVRRAEAVDSAWLATDPVLFNRLVGTRGWPVARFERWLVRTLSAQLIAT